MAPQSVVIEHDGSVLAGRSERMDCRAVGSYPEAEFSWMLNDSPLNHTLVEVGLSLNHTLVEVGLLLNHTLVEVGLPLNHTLVGVGFVSQNGPFCNRGRLSKNRTGFPLLVPS